MLRGIDVSFYQPNINFNLLKSQIDFIFIRASYGVGFVDKCFSLYRDQVRTSGIIHGFYHYAYPQYNSAEDEASWFLQTVGALQEGEILILDFEEKFAGDVVGWCEIFLDKVSSSLNGYKPLIYLNRSAISSHNWLPIVNKGYALWLAAYDSDSNFIDFPTPWATIPFKQYTDSGKVEGITNNVDLNTFFGDIFELKKYGYQMIINNQTFSGSFKERKFLLSVLASLTALINAVFHIGLTPNVLFWILAPILSLLIADGLVDIFKRSR